MNPMLLPLLVGGLVIAMVVMLFVALNRGEDGRASDRLDQLVAAGTVAKALINGSPRWGERYRRVIFQGIAHDLFAADADNWGSVLAIRTGPAEFSKGLVVGLRRNGYRNQDGYVWTCTPEGEPIERVACPDERTFFALAGAAWVEPEDRR